MKKIWLVLLILSIALLGFTACQKEPVSPADDVPVAATHEVPSQDRQPTDVSSQTLEQEESEPEVVSVVSSQVDQATSEVGSTISKAESTVKKSELSSKEPELSFTTWDRSTYEQFTHEVSPQKTFPTVLCHSVDDLTAYLSQNELPAEWAAEYDETYFESNSLLLFEGFEPCRLDWWSVKTIKQDNETLHVALEKHGFGIEAITANRLYEVRIADPLKQIETIEQTVTRYDRDGNIVE